MQSHQSAFPTRQVHLVSSSGVPTLPGETKADMTFFFRTPIVYIPSSYDCVLSCISASIPYVWGNVNASNNTFSVLLDGIESTVSLSPGSYSVDNIVSILGTRIPALTFAYNMNSHLVSISHESLNFTLTDSSMSAFLGFVENKTSAELSLISTKPINMIRTTSVFIDTPDLLCESFDSRMGGQSGIICRVPVSGSPGNLITWTNIFGTSTKLAFKQINHVRIRLLDDDRNVLDTRGYTWTVTLQFSVEESHAFIEGDWLQTDPGLYSTNVVKIPSRTDH